MKFLKHALKRISTNQINGSPWVITPQLLLTLSGATLLMGVGPCAPLTPSVIKRSYQDPDKLERKTEGEQVTRHRKVAPVLRIEEPELEPSPSPSPTPETPTVPILFRTHQVLLDAQTSAIEPCSEFNSGDVQNEGVSYLTTLEIDNFDLLNRLTVENGTLTLPIKNGLITLPEDRGASDLPATSDSPKSTLETPRHWYQMKALVFLKEGTPLTTEPFQFALHLDALGNNTNTCESAKVPANPTDPQSSSQICSMSLSVASNSLTIAEPPSDTGSRTSTIPEGETKVRSSHADPGQWNKLVLCAPEGWQPEPSSSPVP